LYALLCEEDTGRSTATDAPDCCLLGGVPAGQSVLSRGSFDLPVRGSEDIN